MYAKKKDYIDTIIEAVSQYEQIDNVQLGKLQKWDGVIS